MRFLPGPFSPHKTDNPSQEPKTRGPEPRDATLPGPYLWHFGSLPAWSLDLSWRRARPVSALSSMLSPPVLLAGRTG
ncbi:unnamed protein product [Symbiodinium microadriaticum]|nr:unnamed protein product [Symbiodinium microadriaticum]